MSKKLLLSVLAGLVIATTAASPGFAQSSGSDADGDGISDGVDGCPAAPGPVPANGCPDADGDLIGDIEDTCPTASSLGTGADLDRNGCIEPISSLSFRFRFNTGKPGIRLTRLRLNVILGITQIRARWRCRGVGCGGRIRKRGRSLVFRVTRRRLRPGTVLKIETRNAFGGGAQECFTFRVRRRGGARVTSRRAITLGLPSIRC